jgi:hypothetical protein
LSVTVLIGDQSRVLAVAPAVLPVLLNLDNEAANSPVLAVISESGGFLQGDDVAVDGAVTGAARRSALNHGSSFFRAPQLAHGWEFRAAVEQMSCMGVPRPVPSRAPQRPFRPCGPRREIHTLLSRGGAVHQLQRAIHAGRVPNERGRRGDEMTAISGAHALLTNIACCRRWPAVRSIATSWSVGCQ